MYISRLPPPLLSFPQALSSLKKYPLPLNNGKEAKILQNFGDGICKILDDRLEKYYRVNGELIFTAYPACTLPSLSLTPRYFIIFQFFVTQLRVTFVLLSVSHLFLLFTLLSCHSPWVRSRRTHTFPPQWCTGFRSLQYQPWPLKSLLKHPRTSWN